MSTSQTLNARAELNRGFARRAVLTSLVAFGWPSASTAADPVERVPSTSADQVLRQTIPPHAAPSLDDFDTGRLALLGGDYRNAYLAFRTAVRTAANDDARAKASLGACQALIADGSHDDAIDQLSEWIDTYPTHPQQFVARIMLAVSMQSSRRPDIREAAIPAWHEVLYVGAVPCSDAVRVRTAAHLRSLGRLEEARTELVTALIESTLPDTPSAARLLVAESARTQAIHVRDSANVVELAATALDAATGVGRLPEDVAQAAWHLASASLATGDAARADALRWQILDAWPETAIAWQAVNELGATRVPAIVRATVAAANAKWEAVRDATAWLLANAPDDPGIAVARALRGIAANALGEPLAGQLLDDGGVPAGGSRWGARALWEAAERRRAAGDLDGAVMRLRRVAETFPDTREAGQANYLLGRLLPGLGDVVGGTRAMNLAADIGPVGFHTVRARHILRRKPPSAPNGTEAFVATGAITDADWSEWHAWLRSNSSARGSSRADASASPTGSHRPAREASSEAFGPTNSKSASQARSQLATEAAGSPSPISSADSSNLGLALSWEPGRGADTENIWSAPDMARAVGRLDALLASGLLPESEDAARELCQLRTYTPDTVAAVASRLREGGHIGFSMTLGHRLIRILEDAGYTSTLALPAVVRKLAYPLAYARLVGDSAAREGIDPYLLLALMKQESWFNPRAESTASARGLTQFIRPTAAAIARELGWPNWSWDDLFHPYVAIPFGARYLSSLLKDFRENVLYATAAYNAGPAAVRKWIGGNWDGDPDQFVAAIPYGETRAYVTVIATSTEIYRDTYGSVLAP